MKRLSQGLRPTLTGWQPVPQKRRPGRCFRNGRAVNLATTYSRGAYRSTTIGCSGLNCRVRDGNGWDPWHLVTRKSVLSLARFHAQEENQEINKVQDRVGIFDSRFSIGRCRAKWLSSTRLQFRAVARNRKSKIQNLVRRLYKRPRTGDCINPARSLVAVN